MKKIICLIFCLLLTGCSSATVEDGSISILAPSGAPSLAFVSVYEDICVNGTMDIVDGSDLLMASLVQEDSEYDIIVAPINVGCALQASGQTEYKIAAVITWGNLYLVGTSSDSLSTASEIALFGQSTVPQIVYDQANIETDAEAVYYSSATIVQQMLLAGQVEVGMLAEPLATATIASASSNGIDLEIIADLQEGYGDEGYPQAAIFVKADSDVELVLSEVEAYVNGGFENYSDYLEAIGVETLSIPSVEITVSTLDRQNIRYVAASEVTEEIAEFLQLFNIEFSEDMLAS